MDRRRCERVKLTTAASSRTASAYRGRLRSLKERAKRCTYTHIRCNALATDLEIVSSTPTRRRRSRREARLRLFMSRAPLRAKNGMPSRYIALAKLPSVSPLYYPLAWIIISWTRTSIFCLVLFGIVARGLLIVLEILICKFDFISMYIPLCVCERFESRA